MSSVQSQISDKFLINFIRNLSEWVNLGESNLTSHIHDTDFNEGRENPIFARLTHIFEMLAYCPVGQQQNRSFSMLFQP